jgi:hypothetical protein
MAGVIVAQQRELIVIFNPNAIAVYIIRIVIPVVTIPIGIGIMR